MIAEDIKWLHVELSSRCNAWCPACSRNKNGYGVQDWLVEQDLDIRRYQDILNKLPNLHAVQLCGNYGDPIIAHNILDIIELSKRYVEKIQIHTNGSLRNARWWADLALMLKDTNHDVWFGIDGLEGVHEIYRQGTSYTKIIENATAFIENGGHATWQFIPYQHNEHQLIECLKTSKKLKFKNFHLCKQLRADTFARHYRTGQEFTLAPPTSYLQFVKLPSKHTQVDPSDCMHQEMTSIYLSADGQLSTCCFHSNVAKFDTVDELLYNKLNLSHHLCLENCGS